MPTRYDKEFKQNIINLYKQGEQRPNLLKQDFSTTGLNQKWTADIG